MIPYGQTCVVHQLPLNQRIKKMEFDVGFRGHPGLVALFSEAAYNEQIRLGRPTLDFKQWEYFNLPEKYCRDLILFVHVAGKEMWSDDRSRGDDREADIIILATIRRGREEDVDERHYQFLLDKKRTTVALTCAKEGVIVIGDCKVLKQSTV
ncbi:unnamed protein product [Enterobius vermicularis]|uniref:AAA_12 domain-containing protein n=1 Tax=Enterobius vermicularis TaxID=51028 RepID=A0A0N4VGE5_ENTVE|nr:unnamed protein product [Enterobius vermicularis]